MWIVLIFLIGVFVMRKYELVTVIKAKSRLYDVDWRLTFSIAYQESRLDPNAVGDDGHSVGLMQILDTTAEWLVGRPVPAEELKQPEINIELGVRYIRYQLERYQGNIFKAVGAYNAGTYKESPEGVPVNRTYIQNVMAVYDTVQTLTAQ